MSEPRDRLAARLDAVLGVSASVILAVMMLLTCADVFARYVFNAPLRGAFETTELMLVVAIFAGLPLVSRADEHVAMDFIDHLLSESGRRVLEACVQAVSAAIMFLMAWLTWLKAIKIGGYGDSTDVIHIPVAPFVYFMSIMIAVTGVVHVFKIFRPGQSRAIPL
jgi:TRAP-type C4-dicarboxylate transport system permease small subunit